jgi:hypothetical protein
MFGKLISTSCYFEFIFCKLQLKSAKNHINLFDSKTLIFDIHILFKNDKIRNSHLIKDIQYC